MLEIVEDDASADKSTKEGTMLHFMQDFEFVFLLHLMKKSFRNHEYLLTSITKERPKSRKCNGFNYYLKATVTKHEIFGLGEFVDRNY